MGVGVILVAALWLTTLRLVRDTRVSLVPPLRLGRSHLSLTPRRHAASMRTNTTVDGAVGSLGGVLTWSAAPTLVIR